MGMTQEASTECVQMKLYDARGIANLASSDKSIMCSSGGTGTKMLRKVYDDTTNVYPDWIPRPAFYNRGTPVLDCEAILMPEEVELHSRVRAGASYGRTQLPRDLLNRALEMTIGTGYQGESLEDQRAKEEDKKDLNLLVEC